MLRRISTNFNKYSRNINSRYFSRTINIFDKKEYTKNEEWFYHTMESTKVGFTQKAIDELSDIIYIEYAFEKGDIVKENEDMIIVDSVKATNSITAPYDLVVLGNNKDLEEDLTSLNENPECVDNSWIIKIDKIL